jgi:hypothetical protein
LLLVPQPLAPIKKRMLRDALFLTEPPYGQPAALLRSNAFAPLIVFGDRLLIDNSFGHKTAMQPSRTFGKRIHRTLTKFSRKPVVVAGCSA